MEVLSYLVPATIILVFGFLTLSGRTLTIPKGWARLNDRLLDMTAQWSSRLQGGRGKPDEGQST